MKPKVEVQLGGKVFRLRVNNIRAIERALKQRTGGGANGGRPISISRVPGGKRLPLRLSVLHPRLRGIGEKGAPFYARFCSGEDDEDEDEDEDEEEDEDDIEIVNREP